MISKQPIIALYFKFVTVLKFYNLGPGLLTLKAPANMHLKILSTYVVCCICLSLLMN